MDKRNVSQNNKIIVPIKNKISKIDTTMDDIKTKFLDLINKQHRTTKIPAMGFSDYYIQNLAGNPNQQQQQAQHQQHNNAHTTTNNTLVSSPLLTLQPNTSTSNVDANRTKFSMGGIDVSAGGVVDDIDGYKNKNSGSGGDDGTALNSNQRNLLNPFRPIPDQEILDNTESIYFEEEVDCADYEIRKFIGTTLDYGAVQQIMIVLKQQHKVISKKVLQNILEQRTACNNEFDEINKTNNLLKESLLVCKSARSSLSSARSNLTTTSLEILATYKKRETLQDLLKTLHAIRKMKMTERDLQYHLENGNYSGAIEILLECRSNALAFGQFKCVEALAIKLQDIMMLTELQLDNVLNEMTNNFDVKKYSKLQEAYKLLGKTMIAMDQLHMHFISAIHARAISVLRDHVDMNSEEKCKMIFEQMCENISAERYIPCLIELCKSFWSILVCYYQVTMWHQNVNLFKKDKSSIFVPSLSPLKSTTEIITTTTTPLLSKSSSTPTFSSNTAGTMTPALPSNDEYIQQKFKNGQSRIWNDIQSKCCIFLSITRIHDLKYEQFIQVLSIVQRLRKVGLEFCGEPSINLMDTMRIQTESFFKRYHASRLDEICLFLDNEAWVAVSSFTGVTQLQEFNSVKKSLKRYLSNNKNESVEITNNNNNGSGVAAVITVPDDSNTINKKQKSTDNDDGDVPQPPQITSSQSATIDEQFCSSSINSQDGSTSTYGSCGYFYRFSEKSSPFDGGFDESMLEEDILAGIADESSCYFSEESSEEERAAAAIASLSISSSSSTPPSVSSFVDPNINNNNNNNTKLSNTNTNLKNSLRKMPENITTTTASPTTVLVNNSSLNILRCIGRYLQMCKLFHSISQHIVSSMAELIDFYIFVVHYVFGNDLPVPSENLYTPILTRHLARISCEIIPKIRNWPPTFSMVQVDLCNPETMYGLQQRINSVESCISLFQQFHNLRGYLEHLLPVDNRKPLNDYLTETGAYVCDIRKPVFMCVTARAIDLQNILTAMSKVKWDINHVNVEHSQYVEHINRGIQMFAMRMEEICMIPIAKQAIWDSLAHVLTHTLVEGYGNAKKCTAGGRALMQMDFAHFMSILELLSLAKHPIHRLYVDGYIKAFYMPKDLLEEWCREQKQLNNYSIKQLTTLVQCTCSNDKKTRQKLLQIVEQQIISTSTTSLSSSTLVGISSIDGAGGGGKIMTS